MADESQSRCINEVLTFKQQVPGAARPPPRSWPVEPLPWMQARGRDGRRKSQCPAGQPGSALAPECFVWRVMAGTHRAVCAGGGGCKGGWWVSLPVSVCWQCPRPVPRCRCIPPSRRCSSHRALSAAPGWAAKQSAVALGKLRHRASWWTRVAMPRAGSALWVLSFRCRGRFCL